MKKRACYAPHVNPVARMRRGHAAAAARARALARAEGPQPARAVAEALAAIAALASMGSWPAPRDPATERSVEEVCRRWARIERRARAAAAR
jgi:hypothetical protein